MRMPEFWSPRPGVAGTLAAGVLAPLGALVGLAARTRHVVVRPWKAPVPVICIGNLTVGGAGKTPTALALAKRIATRGMDAHFLTRGYRGTASGPLRVDPDHHDATVVGDEALLLAAAGMTWVGADRVASARAAVGSGADLLIMDDGFQNPGLAKDLSLLVVDGEFGFGNGLVMPAGPLRESVGDGLARAHGIVMIGADKTSAGSHVAGRFLPVIDTALAIHPDDDVPCDEPVIAFAGLGRPGKFFASLEAAGCTVLAGRTFADHHRYTDGELTALDAQARENNATLVTTEKDAIRLPPKWRERVGVVRIQLEWSTPAQIDALLDPLLTGAAGD